VGSVDPFAATDPYSAGLDRQRTIALQLGLPIAVVSRATSSPCFEHVQRIFYFGHLEYLFYVR
jgi:hypothetical protein